VVIAAIVAARAPVVRAAIVVTIGAARVRRAWAPTVSRFRTTETFGDRAVAAGPAIADRVRIADRVSVPTVSRFRRASRALRVLGPTVSRFRRASRASAPMVSRFRRAAAVAVAVAAGVVAGRVRIAGRSNPGKMPR